jgi:hypothetical protein
MFASSCKCYSSVNLSVNVVAIAFFLKKCTSMDRKNVLQLIVLLTSF